MSIASFVNSWIETCYPWVGATSFADIYERLFIPVDGFAPWSPRKVFNYILPIVWAISVIIKAFILPYTPSKYDWIFGYSKESLGLIGKSAWMATGFALTEVIIIRLWLTIVNHRKIPSYKLLLDRFHREQQDLYEVFFSTSKLACWSMAIFAAFLFVWLHVISLEKYIELQDVKSIVSCSVWIVISLIAPFYAGPDVATIFVLAITCYYIIHLKARQMIDSLSDIRQIDGTFLRSYCLVLRMIQQLTPLSGILMLIGDILIIPTYSVVLYTLNIDGNINQLILKVILFTIGTVYAVRAYVLTGVFSGVDTLSRRLHALICSILARNQALRPSVKSFTLNHILQDLGSPKKHMTVREYSVYTVNQMDLLNSILGTWQLILLIFDFKNTLPI